MSAGFCIRAVENVCTVMQPAPALRQEILVRYNHRPGSKVPVLFWDPVTKQNTINTMKWGLVPAWTSDPTKTFDQARSETISTKKSFKNLYATQRCCLLADGYYDYSRAGSPAWFTSFKDKRVFCVGAIWRKFVNPKTHFEQNQICILTTEKHITNTHKKSGTATGRFSAKLPQRTYDFNKRVPVVVDGAYLEEWLDPSLDQPEQFLPIFKPVEDIYIHLRRVGTAASYGLETTDCLQPPTNTLSGSSNHLF